MSSDGSGKSHFSPNPVRRSRETGDLFISRGDVLDTSWLYIKSQLTNARVQYTMIMGRYDSHNTKKKVGAIVIELMSTQSLRVSLASIRDGSGGLDAHRQAMLNRAPCSGDWAKFPLDHLTMKDLAYLTAKTGHEFAILRGKSEDILFHGENARCTFDDILVEMLLSNRLRIYGHSHPGEDVPIPSPQDRETLIMTNQHCSKLISGRTGTEITYTASLFDDSL